MLQNELCVQWWIPGPLGPGEAVLLFMEGNCRVSSELAFHPITQGEPRLWVGGVDGGKATRCCWLVPDWAGSLRKSAEGHFVLAEFAVSRWGEVMAPWPCALEGSLAAPQALVGTKCVLQHWVGSSASQRSATAWQAFGTIAKKLKSVWWHWTLDANARTHKGFGSVPPLQGFRTDGNQCIFGKTGKGMQQVLLQWHFILFYPFSPTLKIGCSKGYLSSSRHGKGCTLLGVLLFAKQEFQIVCWKPALWAATKDFNNTTGLIQKARL